MVFAQLSYLAKPMDLYEMEIENHILVDSILKYDKDIRTMHGIKEKMDTLAVVFNPDNGKVNVFMIKYDSDFLFSNMLILYGFVIRGIARYNNSVFILCGDAGLHAKYKNKSHVIKLMEGLPPIDAYPPMWTFSLEGNRVKLFERYIPRDWKIPQKKNQRESSSAGTLRKVK